MALGVVFVGDPKGRENQLAERIPLLLGHHAAHLWKLIERFDTLNQSKAETFRRNRTGLSDITGDVSQVGQSEVVPESWTGRIVNPKTEERSTCQRNDVSTVPI